MYVIVIDDGDYCPRVEQVIGPFTTENDAYVYLRKYAPTTYRAGTEVQGRDWFVWLLDSPSDEKP